MHSDVHVLQNSKTQVTVLHANKGVIDVRPRGVWSFYERNK